MDSEAVQRDEADIVFRRKFREKLVARGYSGAELEHKIDELMNAPVRIRLEPSERPFD